jgi:hypothetical protein
MLRRRRSQGQKDVCHRRILRLPGHHADDNVGALVEFDFLAEGLRVRPKMGLPEGIAQHRYAIPPRLGLALFEEPSQKGACPQHGEEGR